MSNITQEGVFNPPPKESDKLFFTYAFLALVAIAHAGLSVWLALYGWESFTDNSFRDVAFPWKGHWIRFIVGLTFMYVFLELAKFFKRRMDELT